MPNTVVKLINAESTRPEAAREDRKLLIKRERTFRDGCPFSFTKREAKSPAAGNGGRNKLLIRRETFTEMRVFFIC